MSNIAAVHFRRINNPLSSKQAGNPRTYRINSTFKHMHINVCAHAQRRVSKHLKARLILKVRGLAVDCQKQTVESAESFSVAAHPGFNRPIRNKPFLLHAAAVPLRQVENDSPNFLWQSGKATQSLQIAVFADQVDRCGRSMFENNADFSAFNVSLDYV